jgi:hypothetical protein
MSQHDSRDESRPPAEQVPASHGANQVRDEPVPASHQAPKRPAAVVRNEEAAAASPPEGRPDQGRRDDADADDEEE